MYKSIYLCGVSSSILMPPATYCIYRVSGRWQKDHELVTFLIALALIGTSTSAAWSLVDPIMERSVVTRPSQFRLPSRSY